VQNGPPIIRRSNLRRPTPRQIARRRATVVIAVVIGLITLWQFWPSGGTTGAAGPTPTGGGASQPPPSTASPSVSIKPGSNPIQHVIFLVKENHTFDNYFGTRPAARPCSATRGTRRDRRSS